MHKLYHFVFFCIVLCSYNAVKSQHYPIDTFKIKGKNSDVLNPYLLILKDHSNQWTVNEVVKRLENHQFTRDQHRVFNSKYTRSSYWFALPIKNVSKTKLPVVWSFYNNNFGLDFYDISDKKSPKFIDRITSKDHLDQRPFLSRSFGLPFDLEAGESKLILVKVYPENANQIYFLSDISTTEDILFWEINYALLVGKYLGYTFFMLLFNLFLFFVLKQQLHFWHAMYILSIMAFTLNENMMDIFYFTPKTYHLFSLFPKMYWLLISLCFCIIVFQKFTKQRDTFPRLYKVLHLFKRVSVIVIFVITVVSVTTNFQHIIFFSLRLLLDVLLLFGTSFLFYCIIYGSFKKNRQCLAFLISTAFLLAAYINYLLDASFRIHLYYIQPGNILVGLVIEITILTGLFILKLVKEGRNNQTLYILQNLENQMLTKRLLKIQEEERTSIARELHDGVGSHLSGLKVSLQNLFGQEKKSLTPKQDDIIAQVSTIYQDLRLISHQLLPSFIEDNNLIELLRTRIDFYLKHNPKLQINLQQNINDLKLEQQQNLHIYRIITALTDNALKHSDCLEINIQIYYENGILDIMIEDDGKGYNILEKHNGIGLRSVLSRIAFLKGKQTVESNHTGTTYIIGIPI